MKMIPTLNLILIACLCSFSSCKKEELTYVQGDLKISIETGENWTHDFPLFLGMNKKNAPQFAVWIEDTNGKYLSTVFVTQKIATEGWISNDGNRRKESLPHWCYQRGIVYEDGLLLPTKQNPLADGITGATPKADKTLQIRINDLNDPIVVKAEFNHSIDFNAYFPENAEPGDENYSGGNMGSGQPAVVYSATIYPGESKVDLKLIGRSSSDGTNGTIYLDLDKLTTATTIVKNISIQVVN